MRGKVESKYAVVITRTLIVEQTLHVAATSHAHAREIVRGEFDRGRGGSVKIGVEDGTALVRVAPCVLVDESTSVDASYPAEGL